MVAEPNEVIDTVGEEFGVWYYMIATFLDLYTYFGTMTNDEIVQAFLNNPFLRNLCIRLIYTDELENPGYILPEQALAEYIWNFQSITGIGSVEELQAEKSRLENKENHYNAPWKQQTFIWLRERVRELVRTANLM